MYNSAFIEPILKPLYANMKRLRMGEYFHAKEFSLFILESNLDGIWEQCKQEVADKHHVIMLGFHNTEDDEEAFMYLASDWLRRRPQTFGHFITTVLLNFAEWNPVKSDYRSIVSNLKQLSLTEGEIEEFEREFAEIQNTKKLTKEETKQGEPVKSEKKESVPTTMQKVFISHASADKQIVDELLELLELIGVPHDKIFYTSSPEYGITPGEDFLARIKAEISEEVLVIFAMSHNFYNSPVCLCEMGAAWVMSRMHIPVLIPPFGFKDIRGVIPQTQGVVLTNVEQINVFARTVATAFGLPIPTQNTTWERKRGRILERVNQAIAAIGKGNAPIKQSSPEPDHESGTKKPDMSLGGIHFPE
jgi:hypothetical protein